MTQLSRFPFLGVKWPETVTINVSTQQEIIRAQPSYASTVEHFLDVARAYLAICSTSSLTPVEQHRSGSSGACDLPAAGRPHPVRQFQTGGQHVAQ